MLQPVASARKISGKGSWHFRLVHQTTSYDKVYIRFPSCRHQTDFSALAGMTAVAAKQHQTTLVQYQFPGSNKLSTSHSLGVERPGS